MANVIIRRPSPSKANGGKGQSDEQAISAATGWEYEHGETDDQINAIEALILGARASSGASHENKGSCDEGRCLRGAAFSWSFVGGNVKIGTSYMEPLEGGVANHRGVTHDGFGWVAETWVIDPAGNVIAEA